MRRRHRTAWAAALACMLAPMSGCGGPAAATPPPQAAPERTSGASTAPTIRAVAGPAPQVGLDSRLTGFPYPFPVKLHRLQAQGQSLELAYMDVAPAAADATVRAPVLLLHGKNFSGAYWAATIDALRRAGHRVIVPDQIGFGKSSKPRAFQWSFQALATHTASLLDALGVERVAVVGHSMGGMLATRLALMYPARVVKLALVNPIGLEDWKRVVPYQTVDAWYRQEFAKTPAGIQRYMTDSYFDGAWKPEYEPLLTIQAGWSQGPDADHMAWVSALTYDMIFTQPVVYELGALPMPVLLIIGQRDRTALGKPFVSDAVAAELGRYDRLGRAAADAIPRATLVSLDGVGHIPQFEAFEPYRRALSAFLAETE